MLTKLSDRPPALIGLIAPCMGSGKTTIAEEMVAIHGFTRMGFADTGKRMVKALLEDAGMTPLQVNDHLYGSSKNSEIPALGGTSVRHMMQTLGTEWGRLNVNPQLWYDLGIARAKAVMNARVVFDDVRFLNEAVGIRLAGGWIIRVVRPDAVLVNAHASEGLLDDFNVDATIVNGGPLSDIPALVADLMSRFHI